MRFCVGVGSCGAGAGGCRPRPPSILGAKPSGGCSALGGSGSPVTFRASKSRRRGDENDENDDDDDDDDDDENDDDEIDDDEIDDGAAENDAADDEKDAEDELADDDSRADDGAVSTTTRRHRLGSSGSKDSGRAARLPSPLFSAS